MDTWTLFGLRSKKQLTTRFSPFYLMFGRKAKYPSQVQENYEVSWNVNIFSIYCEVLNPLLYSYELKSSSITSFVFYRLMGPFRSSHLKNRG